MEQAVLQVLLHLLQGFVELLTTLDVEVLLKLCEVEPFHKPVALQSKDFDGAFSPRKLIVSALKMQTIRKTEGVFGVSTT